MEMSNYEASEAQINNLHKDTELQMFELLEHMTGSQSFCSTSSTVKRFVNTKVADSEDEDEESYSRNQQTLLATRLLELEEENKTQKRLNELILELRKSIQKQSTDIEQSKRSFETIRITELEVVEELRMKLIEDRAHVTKVTLELSNALEKTNAETGIQEIISLRKELNDLEEELQDQTTRWAGSARIFKTTIEDLRNENSALKKCLAQLKTSK